VTICNPTGGYQIGGALPTVGFWIGFKVSNLKSIREKLSDGTEVLRVPVRHHNLWICQVAASDSLN